MARAVAVCGDATVAQSRQATCSLLRLEAGVQLGTGGDADRHALGVASDHAYELELLVVAQALLAHRSRQGLDDERVVDLGAAPRRWRRAPATTRSTAEGAELAEHAVCGREQIAH
ncbi:MAG: hypothetical protein KY463_13385, partial [Actinobacteria bacterium]|nr:hypothetical protein [Actinomycetota bacterium]